MFEYHSKDGQLYIRLPDKIQFNVDFLNAMTELAARSYDPSYKEICVLCTKEASYDKMSKAYLLNVLLSFSSDKIVKWNLLLSDLITSKVHRRDGSHFEEVDLVRTYVDDNLDYFEFTDDGSVSMPVGEMAKLLVEKNMTLNANEVKEFLSTMIGEIFSNCFLHSNQDKAFFMYDILLQDDFYLCVNIIDYGTTLIHNVKKYFKEIKNREISSTDCFYWAIRSGTTTREGSGGYGLATLIDYISEAKGELYIFSGDAYYALKDQKAVVEASMGEFRGTSVTFKVKLFESSNIITYDSTNNKLVTVSLDCL